MKVALQLGLLPGDTVADKARWARDHGVEGIELGIWGGGVEKLKRDADQIGGIVPISSVCGNADAAGNTSFDFLDPDPAKRRLSIDGSRAILEFCGQVGAAGQVVPPIFGAAKVPDLSPVMTPLELEDRLMVAACRELGPVAAANRTVFMLEPPTGTSSTISGARRTAVRIIEEAGVEGIGLRATSFTCTSRRPTRPRPSVTRDGTSPRSTWRTTPGWSPAPATSAWPPRSGHSWTWASAATWCMSAG